MVFTKHGVCGVRLGGGVLSSSSNPRNRGLAADAGAGLPKALRERSSSDIFQSNSHWLVPSDGPKENQGYPTGHDTGLDKRSEKMSKGDGKDEAVLDYSADLW